MVLLWLSWIEFQKVSVTHSHYIWLNSKSYLSMNISDWIQKVAVSDYLEFNVNLKGDSQKSLKANFLSQKVPARHSFSRPADPRRAAKWQPRAARCKVLQSNSSMLLDFMPGPVFEKKNIKETNTVSTFKLQKFKDVCISSGRPILGIKWNIIVKN